MKDDLISRQAAIDEAYEIIIDGQKFEVVQVETLMGLPSAQPDEQCDNCHYKHIWMTQRMNGNGFFGHGGATG